MFHPTGEMREFFALLCVGEEAPGVAPTRIAT